MDWKSFFKVFLRNVLITTVLLTLLLGLIGFLVAGQQGLKNGATWGFVLGLVSAPFMAGIIGPKYWGDYAGRYGKWHVQNETEGEE
jgi:hypothetical protein